MINAVTESIIIFSCKKVLFRIGRMNSWDFGFGAWRTCQVVIIPSSDECMALVAVKC